LTPINGGLITSPVVTIDNSPGDQEAPHLSGDLTCYADYASGVGRTYRFSSGSHDGYPPAATSYFDSICDISGSRIAFLRALSGRPLTAQLFDVGTGTVTELAPNPDQFRHFVAIGGTTVAFQEHPAPGSALTPDVAVVD